MLPRTARVHRAHAAVYERLQRSRAAPFPERGKQANSEQCAEHPQDAPVPALHGEGDFLDLFFHIRSLPDTESLKDAICDILADRPPRDLAEGGHASPRP